MSETQNGTDALDQQNGGPGKHRGQAAATEETEAAGHGRHRRPRQEAQDESAA